MLPFLVLLVSGLIVGIAVFFGALLSRDARTPPLYFESLAWRAKAQLLWLVCIVVCAGVPLGLTIVEYTRIPRSSGLIYLVGLDPLQLALVAIPSALVVARGGLNVSVTGIAALAAVIVGRLDFGGSPVTGIVVALCAGVGIGIVNALVVVLARIPAIMLTLGTSAIAHALAASVIHGTHIWFPTPFASFVGKPLALPYLWLGVMIWAVIITLVSERVPAGHFTRVMPSPAMLDRLLYAGLPLVLSALGAAMAGVMMALRVRGANPQWFATLPWEATLAVLAGGTCFKGKNAFVFGAMICSPLVLAIGTVTNVLKLPSYQSTLFLGVGIFIFAALSHAYHAAVMWYYHRYYPPQTHSNLPNAFPLKL